MPKAMPAMLRIALQAGKLCAPQIRGIRVIRLPRQSPATAGRRGLVLCSFFLFVSIRPAAAGFVVGSESLKKFSLNPVEGISTSDLNVQPSTAESATATTDYPPSRKATAGKPGLARITMRKRNK
jgi:hypothetical protein